MKTLREEIEDLCDYYGLLEYFDTSKMRSVYREEREEILDQLVAVMEKER